MQGLGRSRRLLFIGDADSHEANKAAKADCHSSLHETRYEISRLLARGNIPSIESVLGENRTRTHSKCLLCRLPLLSFVTSGLALRLCPILEPFLLC